ncbi:uncharacterized protein B0H18DRAFT_556687 [Fomitopsis serialis]|uniref:uncharacterized protein n=1 Tax=Fomitopsis serialis TaxID=139415 RepID=UPI0020087A3E|nr:uncharacterized protein B0H18DRAFT_556687 [Neoantrodia serialis]KAH9934355.1 hypothetical protein B0H18DRAFT_556687 [Neoantrodia serialis]
MRIKRDMEGSRNTVQGELSVKHPVTDEAAGYQISQRGRNHNKPTFDIPTIRDLAPGILFAGRSNFRHVTCHSGN